MKKAASLQEKRQQQSNILPKVEDWNAEDWGKAIFSDQSHFQLFGASGKELVWGRNAEPQHQSSVMPTVKHS